MTPTSGCNHPVHKASSRAFSGQVERAFSAEVERALSSRKALRSRTPLTTTRGFTLLEILLVLSIIGMASVLVVPNLTGLEARTFSAQLRQANSVLNYARRIAVVSGQSSTVSINADGAEELDEEDSASSAIEQNIVGSWDSSGIQIRFRDSTEREVEIEDKIEITFYPEGGSTGGTLVFSQEEREASIIINPFTGRISSVDDQD